MARGINKVILIGNLGTDPEVRYMPTGGAVANLTIATSESWTDKTTNEKKENTEWHRVVIYQRLAEIAGEYLRKGSKVYIEGRLRTRKWQDQQGVERYTTEIIANELQMLDGRGEGQGAGMGQAPAMGGGAPMVSKAVINNLPLHHNNVCHKQLRLRAVMPRKLRLLQHRHKAVTSNVQLRAASRVRAILTSHKAVLIRQHHNNVAQWNPQSTLTTIFRSEEQNMFELNLSL